MRWFFGLADHRSHARRESENPVIDDVQKSAETKSQRDTDDHILKSNSDGSKRLSTDLNDDEDGHRQHGREKEDVLDEGLDVFGFGNRDADADEDDLDEHEAEAPDERFQDASTDRLLFASQRVFESAHG